MLTAMVSQSVSMLRGLKIDSISLFKGESSLLVRIVVYLFLTGSPPQNRSVLAVIRMGK